MNTIDLAPRDRSAGRRILVGCRGIVGRGGASTVAYRLHQVLSAAGADVRSLAIVEEEFAEYYRYAYGEQFGNPASLPEAVTCVLQSGLGGSHPELSRAIEAAAPDVLLAIGTISATLLKRAAPTLPLVLLTTGCQQMMELIARGEVKDFLAERDVLMRSPGRPRVCRPDELRAVDGADLVVTHAEVVRFLYCSFFPQRVGKIWPEILSFADWIFEDAAQYAHLARPFAERDVDVLFVASNWSRPEKSYPLVQQIVSRLGGARVHIVGDADSRCPGAVHHGFIEDRAALFGLLGRARTVVSPSAFDAAPGILFEASSLGCNVVASPNCGNAHLCHEDLLVSRADAPSFVRALEASLTRKYDDHAADFWGTAPTQRLLDILQVV